MPLRVRTKVNLIIAFTLSMVLLSFYFISQQMYDRHINDMIAKGIRGAEDELREREKKDIEELSALLDVFLKDKQFKDTPVQ